MVCVPISRHPGSRQASSSISIRNCHASASSWIVSSISPQVAARQSLAEITSTASPEPIVTKEQFVKAMKVRKRKPVFAVDIAVPRDIAPDVADVDDVYLYTIDDLHKVIQDGQTSREAAAVDANRILDDEIRRYLSIERAKQVSPLIVALREQGETIRDGVLREAQRRLDKGVDSREVIEFATAMLMKKMLHNPSVRLREAAEAEDIEIIDATRILFGIDANGNGNGSQ